MADEGEHPIAERLSMLDGYGQQLDALARGEASSDPVFIALADVIARFALPLSLFHDLLSAFRQDVTKTRYANFAEVLDYCRRSANPVGRLLLHLHGEASEENLRRSDQICSALQLINFMQDLEQDLIENDRSYLPEDELAALGLDRQALHSRSREPTLLQLIDQQNARIRQMMEDGASLGSDLKGRFGLEIRLITQAGLKVLEKLEQHRGNPWQRPRLKRRDYLQIVWRALWQRH
jgi:squalene synthase HpnC